MVLLVLLRLKIVLVVLLGLDRPSHLKLATIVAQVCRASELVGQTEWVHVLLNPVDYADDIIDVLLKILTLL